MRAGIILLPMGWSPVIAHPRLFYSGVLIALRAHHEGHLVVAELAEQVVVIGRSNSGRENLA
jgi:hypothetical protein